MKVQRNTLQTSIRVPEEVWKALRALAERRALAEGGRPNVSGIVVQLVERETARQADEQERAG